MDFVREFISVLAILCVMMLGSVSRAEESPSVETAVESSEPEEASEDERAEFVREFLDNESQEPVEGTSEVEQSAQESASTTSSEVTGADAHGAAGGIVPSSQENEQQVRTHLEGIAPGIIECFPRQQGAPAPTASIVTTSTHLPPATQRRVLVSVAHLDGFFFLRAIRPEASPAINTCVRGILSSRRLDLDHRDVVQRTISFLRATRPADVAAPSPSVWRRRRRFGIFSIVIGTASLIAATGICFGDWPAVSIGFFTGGLLALISGLVVTPRSLRHLREAEGANLGDARSR